jgi:hypothetical protein
MAEKEATVMILNRGARTYRLKGDVVLAPGTAVSVPESEASALLGYKDLIDASKFVKSPEIGALKAENEKLAAELAALKESIASKSEDEQGRRGRKG